MISENNEQHWRSLNLTHAWISFNRLSESTRWSKKGLIKKSGESNFKSTLIKNLVATCLIWFSLRSLIVQVCLVLNKTPHNFFNLQLVVAKHWRQPIIQSTGGQCWKIDHSLRCCRRKTVQYVFVLTQFLWFFMVTQLPFNMGAKNRGSIRASQPAAQV